MAASIYSNISGITKNAAASTKLWGGRFTTTIDPVMESFNSSIKVDYRMYEEDIKGSIAYAKALCVKGLITAEEADTIINGLTDVLNEWISGKFHVLVSDEDIHTANERRLSEIIGCTVAGKLHTGRSRNDQVTTDMKLWHRKACDELRVLLHTLIVVLTERASKETSLLMPGYTHLQCAQVIRWSHWLLSHAWTLRRDYERLVQLSSRADVCPLGSGALAGNPFHINRKELAQSLGFSGGATANSMDATRDRDFVVELLQWASLCSVHLSLFAEDLVIYSSREFGFVTLNDAYSTGSSLMPQKKNPDSLELIRGKAGTISGRMIGFLMTMKGLPSTYNKDLQEDKAAMFDTVDTMKAILQISAGVISTLTTNEEKMKAALSMEMLATDIAYYLVDKGVPFRNAHESSGQVVKLAESKNVSIDQLSLEDYKGIHPKFESNINELWNFEKSADQYNAIGGTSLSSITEQFNTMKIWASDSLP